MRAIGCLAPDRPIEPPDAALCTKHATQSKIDAALRNGNGTRWNRNGTVWNMLLQAESVSREIQFLNARRIAAGRPIGAEEAGVYI
jgi:hypothetical protein